MVAGADHPGKSSTVAHHSQQALAEFAATKQELLFVEDKTAFVEARAAAILYPLLQRPRITGKHDADGRELLSSDAGFEPLDLALVIAGRGTALPWSTTELALARGIGVALVDIIVQVHAVRLLIAEHPLVQIRGAVAARVSWTC